QELTNDVTITGGVLLRHPQNWSDLTKFTVACEKIVRLDFRSGISSDQLQNPRAFEVVEIYI
ncbi:hypothetical protein Q0O64_14700, partial [Staphylococcus aureus]|nr:hypothetical protein [Staphylococcus aureus]